MSMACGGQVEGGRTNEEVGRVCYPYTCEWGEEEVGIRGQ